MQSGIVKGEMSSQRCYVDNAYNRRVGRVGKPLGTHVIHSSTASAVHSESTRSTLQSSSSSQCYVDNAYNRRVGRVGKPLGTHVIHSSTSSGAGAVHVSGYTRADGTQVSGYTRSSPRSSSGTSSGATSAGQRCYVDNAYNRRLGRVGKPLGTHVVHSNGDVTRTDVRSIPTEPVCAPVCAIRGQVARAVASPAARTPVQRCYVDNAYNRKLGRVGKPLETQCSPRERTYVDNAYNRRLGRVGKPVPPKNAESQEMLGTHTLESLVMKMHELGFSDARRPVYQSVLDRIEHVEVEANWAKNGVDLKTPSIFKHPIPEIIPYDELQVEKEIGHGGFGVVYACLWHGKPVAFKKLLHHQKMTKKRLEGFEKEIKILAALDHPNIVKMFGAVIEKDRIGILMEFMERSLFQALFIDNEEFSSPKKKQMISQLATSLCYLHKHKPIIAHCDIKSGNVLLDQENSVKLCDFGLSSIKYATEASRSSAAAPPAQGTPRYSAPEVLRGEILTMSKLLMADIYSLALVVFEVVVEEEPFEGLNVRQLEANVGHGELRPTSEGIKLSQPVLDLLNSSWDGSAPKRPTAEGFKEKWDKICELTQL